MRIRVVEAGLFMTDCHTRLPFRFGISTLTFAPLCTLRILIETEDGKRSDGFAADLLVPKWFEKDLDKSARDDVLALIGSATMAIDLVRDDAWRCQTVFDHWWELYAERVASQSPQASDLLVRGFGVALVERAMLDAVCRAAGVSFFDALRSDVLGFEPARADGTLRDWTPSGTLPEAPATSIAVRHTVGLLDALREDDIDEKDRVNDGLPESLEADIRRYGLRYFKIKLSGDIDHDLERLRKIDSVLDSQNVDARVTLDGNEQFENMDALAELLCALAADSEPTRLLRGLLYIEQPLNRADTFDESRLDGLLQVENFAPVMIDEADMTLDSFPQAVDLSYKGVSIKNCKGVFRALINLGRCAASSDLFISAEDLTTLPLLALQQDLATVTALGPTHVERNGHHFFCGLNHLSTRQAEGALASHPDLYSREDGRITLRIEDGMLQIGSLQCPGFGYNCPICVDELVHIDNWRWPE